MIQKILMKNVKNAKQKNNVSPALYGVDVGHVEKHVSEKEWNRIVSSKWEHNEFFFISKYLRPEDKVLEVGGCTGIISTVIDKILQNPHTVIEANPSILPCLEETRKVNKARYKILNGVLGPKPEYRFCATGDFAMAGFSPDLSSGNMRGRSVCMVPGIDLKTLLEHNQFNVLVCDIEGAEYALLREYRDLIVSHFDRIIIEFHYRFQSDTANSSIHRECIKDLHKEYTVRKRHNDFFLYQEKTRFPSS